MNFDLSEILKKNSSITKAQQLKYVWALSVPAMLAQISSILMQYIDAGMVGYLGENASAAIGLVAPSTWVLGSLSHAMGIGFTVQVAHAFGAGEKEKVRHLLFQSIIVCLIFFMVLAAASSSISFFLPGWLDAGEEIHQDASFYFLIFALSTPFYGFVYLFSGMLQCTGNMKFPGIMNTAMCLLDIVFNWIFIVVLGFGVSGAAIGSLVSAVVVSIIMFVYTLRFSKDLNLKNFRERYLDKFCVKKAFKYAFPIGVESAAFSGALVIVTKIIAPLGPAAIAANSFATTAESLCYMPGYGIQEAAVTLVGQSYGACRRDLIKSFSWMTIFLGMLIMSLMGVVMYFVCPWVFDFLTPVEEIRLLSVKVLRIELFAEPMFAASIVATGVLRGKGDTLVPGILNLVSLWGVRLGLSLWLVNVYGLEGIWISMAMELCFRGIVMMVRVLVTGNKIPQK